MTRIFHVAKRQTACSFCLAVIYLREREVGWHWPLSLQNEIARFYWFIIKSIVKLILQWMKALVLWWTEIATNHLAFDPFRSRFFGIAPCHGHFDLFGPPVDSCPQPAQNGHKWTGIPSKLLCFVRWIAIISWPREPVTASIIGASLQHHQVRNHHVQRQILHVLHACTHIYL